jgi:hypothetical protein
MKYGMKLRRYTGELWNLPRTHPDLEKLLSRIDLLIEITHGALPYEVVIGVPHHAAVGVAKIAEKTEKSRVSDEGAAMFALAAFTSLRERGVSCKLLIAAHATDHDPNKNRDSPYFQNVIAHPARLLFECHGAKNGRSNDLELTAGKNGLTRPDQFARYLAKALRWRFEVVAQKHPGAKGATVILGHDREEESSLELPGLKTNSLEDAAANGMQALHLEAKPTFRTFGGKYHVLTKDGNLLGRAVATATTQYLDSNEQQSVSACAP